MKAVFDGVKYNADTEEYVVFDIETTGLENAEIVDFAALRVREGKICETYRTYIKPKKKIPLSVTLINGIDDEMVASAPSFSEVAEDILQFFGDEIIVGHCLESFALKILCKELVRAGYGAVENDYIDLMTFAEHCFGGNLENFRLKSIAEFLDVEDNGSTGALADCRTIYECYCRTASFFRKKWTRENVYSELCDDFYELVRKVKRKKRPKELRRALTAAYEKELSDPVMRCAVYLPLIKYELYINCFEDDLKGELYGFKRDYERGLHSRMSIKDIEKVKSDIDYCTKQLEKPKKKWFFF